MPTTAYDVINDTEGDFTLRYCAFLDDFKYQKTKASLIKNEPPMVKHATPKEYALLAAAVHFLASRENLEIPKWVMQEKYFLPVATFPSVFDKEDYRNYMRKTSAPEFAMRNLFYGENVCKRT